MARAFRYRLESECKSPHLLRIAAAAGSQRRLAELLTDELRRSGKRQQPVRQSDVWKWLYETTPRADYCHAMVAVAASLNLDVSCADLRPDVFGAAGA